MLVMWGGGEGGGSLSLKHIFLDIKAIQITKKFTDEKFIKFKKAQKIYSISTKVQNIQIKIRTKGACFRKLKIVIKGKETKSKLICHHMGIFLDD